MLPMCPTMVRTQCHHSQIPTIQTIHSIVVVQTLCPPHLNHFGPYKRKRRLRKAQKPASQLCHWLSKRTPRPAAEAPLLALCWPSKLHESPSQCSSSANSEPLIASITAASKRSRKTLFAGPNHTPFDLVRI